MKRTLREAAFLAGATAVVFSLSVLVLSLTFWLLSLL